MITLSRSQRRQRPRFPVLLATLAFSATLQAGTLLDFEGFADGTALTTQYAGVTFTDATVLSAGIGLNEFEFPPHSGTNVVFDDGGPISITFETPVVSFSGYFTYAEPLALTAFGALGNNVATASSAFSSNDALFGDPGSSPNEFLQVAFAAGISNVTITGDPAGGSFVMDDLAYASSVPESASFYLTLTGAAALLALRRKLT